MTAPSGTNFFGLSGVEGFVKVSNINGKLRLAENLEIQRRISKSMIRDVLNKIFIKIRSIIVREPLIKSK